jgi:phosphopantothenoylcysteine decarboxylase/phosphopantothenate--cysteine ligase
MYSHASTQNNIEGLESNKVKIIYPQEGELASGLAGKGRMTEPEDIRAYLEEEFSLGIDLRGMKILISAGPTYEDIDAVRFIGNRSSGKMGFALAEVCAGLGADVDLISGPVHLSIDHPSVQRIDVRSAKEMHDECIGRFTEADIVIMAAAVADYTPARVSDKKIKKKEGEWAIPLTRTTDILEAIGKAKKAGQVLVGFALETDNEVENARSKMERKNLDLIVLNSLKDSGAGFGHDTNRITIIGKGNFCKEFELKSKREVALDIINTVTEIVQ